MSKKFKKSKIEKIIQSFLGLARKISVFNKTENDRLTEEYRDVLISIKEQNSKAVLAAYYVPKAINAILKEEGYLTSEAGAAPRAEAMLLSDLANGVLDEFYRFK